MKYRFLLFTLLCLIILSNVAFAENVIPADTSDLPWNSLLEKFAGSVDSSGNLNTSGAIFTDILPRIVASIMIVSGAYLYLNGEMSGTTTTIMRMVLAAGFVLNLGMYFSNSFFNVEHYSYAAAEPPIPDPTSPDFVSGIMTYIIWVCQRGSDLIYPYLLMFMIGAAAIETAMHLMMKMEDDIIKYIVSKTIGLGFYFWMLSNWMSGMGIAHTVYSSFEQLGLTAGLAGDSQLMPDSILNNAFIIIDDASSHISTSDGIFVMIVSIILYLFTIAAVFAVSLQLFLCRIEFWVFSLLAMICIGAGSCKWFRFLFEKGIGVVINAGLKVAVVSFILCIVNPLLNSMVEAFIKADSAAQNMAAMLQIVFGCFVIAMLVLKVPNLVQGLLNGSPNLSSGDMYAPMQATKQVAQKAGDIYAGGATQLAKMTVASQMKGGMAARGITTTGAVKQVAGQLAQGQRQEALQTAQEYGGAVKDTFANRFKMMAAGTMRGRYDSVLRDAKQKNQIRADNKAIAKAYTEVNNPDSMFRKIDEHIRDKEVMDMDSTLHLKDMRERHLREMQNSNNVNNNTRPDINHQDILNDSDKND